MKKVLTILILMVLSVCLFAEEWTFTGDNYVANPGGLGDLSSLVINGEEFIEDSYFYVNEQHYNGELSKEDNKLIVTTPYGKAVYTFLPDKIELEVENINASNYFIVFKRDVVFCKDLLMPKFPYTIMNTAKRVVKHKAAIETDGDMKIWGPWEREYMALDYYFNKESGSIKETLIPTTPTDEEYNLVNKIKAPFVVHSPKEYQVFQRQSKKEGYIDFSGVCDKTITDVQYKIEGKDLFDKKVDSGWKAIKLNAKGVFKEKVKVRAGGWYKVQLKYKENDEEKVKVLDHVGVGEVIIGAGQSNSTNCGQSPYEQASGMVSTTDGVLWRYGSDPQLGVHDGSTGGSLYPALGDALYKEFHVPIGIASTGFGGTSIEQWQPSAKIVSENSNLYNWFIKRVLFFGKDGFRCVLWHQGESNALSSTEKSYKGMVELIETSRRDAGFEIPWFVAKASYWDPEFTSFENIRAAQQKLWDDGIAFEGPDTDLLGSEYRDNDGKGIHFNLTGLKKHGEMWSEKLIPYIHSQID